MHPSTVLAAGLAAAIVIGGAIWWSQSTSEVDRSRAETERAYVDAVALCSADPVQAGARIKSLDRIYGEDARPAAIAFDVAVCVAEGAIEQANRSQRLLRSLPKE